MIYRYSVQLITVELLFEQLKSTGKQERLYSMELSLVNNAGLTGYNRQAGFVKNCIGE